jgi:hypothetical protein
MSFQGCDTQVIHHIILPTSSANLPSSPVVLSCTHSTTPAIALAFRTRKRFRPMWGEVCDLSVASEVRGFWHVSFSPGLLLGCRWYFKRPPLLPSLSQTASQVGQRRELVFDGKLLLTCSDDGPPVLSRSSDFAVVTICKVITHMCSRAACP